MLGIRFGIFIEFILLSAVRGQRDATILEFPFQVFVQNASTKAHICGGVIITSKWVLTVKDCAQISSSVLVGYGSSETNQPAGTTTNRRIIFETEPSKSNNPLALIELESEIQFTKSLKQARLPLKEVRYSSLSMKFSGWKIGSFIHKHPTLKVIDKYKVEFDNCGREEGKISFLGNPGLFCGYEEEFPDYVSLEDMGSVVSKDGIVIGLLPKTIGNPAPPTVFVKVSEYENWIKNVLGQDGDAIAWAKEVPKSLADSNAKNAFVLITSVAFILFTEFM